MKTPNKQQSFIKINKNEYHSFQKTKTNKKINTTKKSKDNRLYDEIELKDKLIKENHKKIRRIKIDSIKELVYANKNVPDNWKKKREYPTQVLQIFSEDTKFLNYVGNGGGPSPETNCISKSTYNFKNNSLTNHNNYFVKNFKNLKTYTSTNKDNNNKFRKKKLLNISILKENNKKNTLPKHCHTTPKKRRYLSLKDKSLNEKEIVNIMDELQINYPIKEKLNELFPAEELQKIKIRNGINKTKTNKSLNLKLHCPYIKTEKEKNVIKDNIFINLISSYKSIKNKNNDILLDNGCNKKYSDDPNIDLLKLKKEMLKRPIANKHLERINFYGPFFSYCPPCGVRNLNFYGKLPLNQLIKFTNIIKKYRQRK
jgi:hypothetical protein